MEKYLRNATFTVWDWFNFSLFHKVEAWEDMSRARSLVKRTTIHWRVRKRSSTTARRPFLVQIETWREQETPSLRMRTLTPTFKACICVTPWPPLRDLDPRGQQLAHIPARAHLEVFRSWNLTRMSLKTRQDGTGSELEGTRSTETLYMTLTRFSRRQLIHCLSALGLLCFLSLRSIELFASTMPKTNKNLAS